MAWTFYGGRPPTTGPRDCHECGQPAYSQHLPTCPRTK